MRQSRGNREAIARSIDEKIFSHWRLQLREWKQRHESMFGDGSWAAAGGPDPENLGILRSGRTRHPVNLDTRRTDPDFAEAAGEQWLTLLPKKWNPSTHRQVYSWRYDPRELGAMQAPEADPRRKNARRVVDDA